MFSLIIPAKKTKSIYGVLRPLYYFARAMGLLQFSANLNEMPDLQLYLTNMDWCIVALQFIAVVACAVLSLANSLIHVSILSFGSTILVRMGLLMNCVFLIINLLMRRRIWSVFQRMDEFDTEIKSMGATINYSRHETYTGIFVKVQMFISLLFVALTAYICRNFMGFFFVSGFFLSYVSVNAIFGASLGLFTFLLLNVKLRFKKLNENLWVDINVSERFKRDLKLNRITDTYTLRIRHINSLISPKNGNIKVIHTSKYETVAHVMRLSQLHDKLNDIIETINFCYSFQIMGFVAGSFVFSVVSLYGLYKTWSWSHIDDISIEMSVAHTVWSIYYNTYIVAMLWAGSTMRNEGQRTGLLLHNFINHSNNPDVVDRLMLFSQQLKHRIPEASCKLFTFDWTLLFSVNLNALRMYYIRLLLLTCHGSKTVLFICKIVLEIQTQDTLKIVGATASYLTILIQFDSTSLISIGRNDSSLQNISVVN